MKAVLVPCVFTILFLGYLGHLRATSPLRLEVSPRVTVSAPAQIVFRMRVEPDTRNRELAWCLDGPNYYRSSSTQLEGASAPVSYTEPMKQVPCGTYAARAELHRAGAASVLAEVQPIYVTGAACGE